MTPSKQYELPKDNVPGLMTALKSDNLLWRTHAQRLLIESAKDDVVPALKDLPADLKRDEIGIAAGAFHALWTLHGLGAADPETAIKALKHPASGVRRAALQALPRSIQSAQAILVSGTLTDKEPLVRLTALLSLADQPPSDLVGASLYQLQSDLIIAKDKDLATALTVAASRHGQRLFGCGVSGRHSAPERAQREARGVRA